MAMLESDFDLDDVELTPEEEEFERNFPSPGRHVVSRAYRPYVTAPWWDGILEFLENAESAFEDAAADALVNGDEALAYRLEMAASYCWYDYTLIINWWY